MDGSDTESEEHLPTAGGARTPRQRTPQRTRHRYTPRGAAPPPPASPGPRTPGLRTRAPEPEPELLHAAERTHSDNPLFEWRGGDERAPRAGAGYGGSTYSSLHSVRRDGVVTLPTTTASRLATARMPVLDLTEQARPPARLPPAPAPAPAPARVPAPAPAPVAGGVRESALSEWLAGARLQSQEPVLRSHGVSTVEQLLAEGVPPEARVSMAPGAPERLDRALARRQRMRGAAKLAGNVATLRPSRRDAPPPPPATTPAPAGAKAPVVGSVVVDGAGQGALYAADGTVVQHDPSSSRLAKQASRRGNPKGLRLEPAQEPEPVPGPQPEPEPEPEPSRSMLAPASVAGGRAGASPGNRGAPPPPSPAAVVSPESNVPGIGGKAFPDTHREERRSRLTADAIRRMMQQRVAWEAWDGQDASLKEQHDNQKRTLLTLYPAFGTKQYLCYGLKVAASFPGSLVFREARNPLGLGGVMMALVAVLPWVIVYGLIGDLSIRDLIGEHEFISEGLDSRVSSLEQWVEILVLAVTLLLLVPVLLSLAKSIQTYNSIDSVLHEGMIFRPVLTPRFTMDNLAAFCGFVIELVSHCNAAMTSDYLGFVKPTAFGTWTGEMVKPTIGPAVGAPAPRSWNGTFQWSGAVENSNGGWLDGPGTEPTNSSGTSVVSVYATTPVAYLKNTSADATLIEDMGALWLDSYSALFWTSVSCVFFVQIVLWGRLVLPGKWGWFWTNETLYAELMWAEGMYFINGPLFLPILMFLYKAFECHYPLDGQPPVLKANPEIVCWDGGYHSVMVAFSLLSLGLYLPIATLLPSTTFRETMRDRLDFLFSPVYLQVSFVLKALLRFVGIMYSESDYVKVCFSLGLHVLLLLLNVNMRPCCVPAVNRWRTASFCCSVWLGICGIVHLSFGQQKQGEVQLVIVVMVALGILLIFAGALVASCTTELSPLQTAAEAFAAFEYASKANAMPPRALEPLIALSMTKDNDAAEAVFLKADFAEQIIRLLRRSSCIPADTIGETAGVAYRRARLHRRLKRGASAAVTTSVQMAGTAVRSSSRIVKEAANRNRPPPATPDTHTAVERQATRQASLRAASPRSRGLVPGDPEHLSTPTRTAPSPLVRNMSSMPDVGPSRVNVRVQFSTAWALGNIACRGERYIEKILEAAKKMLHTHGTPLSILSCEYIPLDDGWGDDGWDENRAYIIEPFVWVLEQATGPTPNSEIPLQLEALAALANLTADTGFARVVATVRYDWPGAKSRSRPLLDTLQRGLTSDIDKVASFSALICANLARQSEQLRLRLHTEYGVLYGLTLLCRTYDFLGQKAAVLGLANLAQSAELAKVMAHRDVQTAKAVAAVAKNRAAVVALECATFFANFCCHVEARKTLVEDQRVLKTVEDSLVKLSWSHSDRVKNRAVVTGQLLESARVKRHLQLHEKGRECCTCCMHQPHEAEYDRTEEKHRLQDLKQGEPINSLIGRADWSAWGSKLDAWTAEMKHSVAPH